MHVRSLGLFCAVALCFVAAASASAASSTVKTGIAMRALQQSGPNTDMTSGIIDGISYVAGSPQVCNKAHNDVHDDFVQGSYAFQRAFTQPGNVQDFEQGLRLYGQGIIAVSESLQYCGLNIIVSNWTKVANQISANPSRGVPALLNALSGRISSLHLPDLVNEIHNDINQGLNYQAGVKIGTIVGTILTPNVPDTTWFTFLRTLHDLTGLLIPRN